jgi:hypothetical protein
MSAGLPDHCPVKILFRRHPIGDRGAAAERSSRKADCQFRVPTSWAQLRTWASVKKAPGKIGAVEHRLEEVRALEMSTEQVSLA